ncbi:MAG: DUF4177 domain-containing protein [Prevotellaceae bacterium]|nr:DUF4177 domain-containing protein [Prevotellaceae bacterium]
MKYEFIDVAPKGGLKATKTEAFDECKKIIQEKAAMGWELVQVIAVKNEKTGIGMLAHYTIIFKVND